MRLRLNDQAVLCVEIMLDIASWVTQQIFAISMPAICHNRRTTTFYNFSTTFEAKRMAQEDTRRMKKISRIEYCAGFEPLQSGMEQDEGSRILLPTMKPLDSDKKAAKPAEAAPAAPVVEEKIDFSKVEIEPLFADFVDFDTFSKSDFRAVKVINCEAVKKSKKLLKFVLDDGTGTDRVILSGIHEYYEPEELVGKTCIAITNLPPRPMMGIASEGMLISAVHHENGEERLHLLMVDPHIPAGAKLYWLPLNCRCLRHNLRQFTPSLRPKCVPNSAIADKFR